jgi:hypothetical protein
MRQMLKARYRLLGLAGVLSAFAVLAPPASAGIKFEWKVAKAALAAGESKEFTATTDGHVADFSATAAGASILMLATEIEALAGAKIIGGKPGTGEGTLIIKGVTVDKPAKCAVESEGFPAGTVQTVLLKGEIVESDVTHEPLILFQPKAGSAFTNLLFLNNGTEECVIKNVLAAVTGNILGEPLPALTETVNGHAVLPEPALKTFVLSNGTLESAGLVFGGNEAKLTGLALVLLKSGQAYGAF